MRRDRTGTWDKPRGRGEDASVTSAPAYLHRKKSTSSKNVNYNHDPLTRRRPTPLRKNLRQPAVDHVCDCPRAPRDGHHEMSDWAPPANRFTVTASALRQCGRTSDWNGPLAGSENGNKDHKHAGSVAGQRVECSDWRHRGHPGLPLGTTINVSPWSNGCSTASGCLWALPAHCPLKPHLRR